MAFDHPIEADRVNDLNFFSTFIRAPIIGTLMWLVGGEKARQQEEELIEREKVAAELMSESDSADVPQSSENYRKMAAGEANRSLPSALKKTSPSLAGSEISDIGSCSEAMEGLHLVESKDILSKPAFPKRKKELSWSDEIGHSLVQFIESEVSNVFCAT
jgi:hypothetical protein